MNTNPEMDADKKPKAPPHRKLNEFQLDSPHTIPFLWDVSEMLSTPSVNGSHARVDGSAPAVGPQEQPAESKDRAGKVISELPESDFPGFFFKPY